MNKCVKHPAYKGKRQPLCGCEECWAIYFSKYRFRCECCGKFVAMSDIASGNATHILTTPDSEVSVETYETLCGNCK